MIQIPEILKSSDGSGRLSRTIKGAVGVIVFFGTTYTDITQQVWIEMINYTLIVISGVYGFYGAIEKLRNR